VLAAGVALGAAADEALVLVLEPVDGALR